MVENISWKEFEEKMNLVFGRTFHVVDDLYLNIVRQINFGEWIELDDLEALSYLEKLQKFSGQLCVINDYCYEKKCGPFLLGVSYVRMKLKYPFKIKQSKMFSIPLFHHSVILSVHFLDLIFQNVIMPYVRNQKNKQRNCQ